MKRAVDLLLDSGAYSAWRKGKAIDLRAYGEFCLKHKAHIFRAVSLDVIAGKPGQKPGPLALDESAAAGYKNGLKLRKMGVEAMPVFHQGERFYWLERMLGDGYDYIGISPRNDRPSTEKRRWLDEVFSYLAGVTGYSPVKTHGFGMSVVNLIKGYPWYSVDGTTWFSLSLYGWIPIPRNLDSTPDFSGEPIIITVTKGKLASAEAKNVQSVTHYEHFGPATRKLIREYLEGEGFSMKKLDEDNAERLRAWVRYYQHSFGTFVPARFNTNIPPWDVAGMDNRPAGPTKSTGEVLRYFYSHGPSDNFCSTLYKERIRNRLIAYSSINGKRSSFDLPYYVHQGKLRAKK